MRNLTEPIDVLWRSFQASAMIHILGAACDNDSLPLVRKQSIRPFGLGLPGAAAPSPPPPPWRNVTSRSVLTDSAAVGTLMFTLMIVSPMASSRSQVRYSNST